MNGMSVATTITNIAHSSGFFVVVAAAAAIVIMQSLVIMKIGAVIGGISFYFVRCLGSVSSTFRREKTSRISINAIKCVFISSF